MSANSICIILFDIFNLQKINLDIRSADGVIGFSIDPQQIQNIKIDGMVPVILDIHTIPVASLPVFLGLTTSQEKRETWSLSKF